MVEEGTFVGIDVSKANLDVAFDSGDGEVMRRANGPSDCAALAGELSGARLVVVEATGGYELEIVRALQRTGVPVAVVNPRRVRDFARASGQLAKTDRIDARIIARFAGPCGRRRPQKSKTAAWPWSRWSPAGAS